MMPVPRSLSASCGTCVRFEGPHDLTFTIDESHEVEQIVKETKRRLYSRLQIRITDKRQRYRFCIPCRTGTFVVVRPQRFPRLRNFYPLEFNFAEINSHNIVTWIVIAL